jgi:hypothetical protein
MQTKKQKQIVAWGTVALTMLHHPSVKADTNFDDERRSLARYSLLAD